jgi:hypothetical protein
MRRALKDRLAGYKIPQEMKVLETIPRNAMGKGKSYHTPPLFFSLLCFALGFLFGRILRLNANLVVLQ